MAYNLPFICRRQHVKNRLVDCLSYNNTHQIHVSIFQIGFFSTWKSRKPVSFITSRALVYVNLHGQDNGMCGSVLFLYMLYSRHAEFVKITKFDLSMCTHMRLPHICFSNTYKNSQLFKQICTRQARSDNSFD